MKDIVKQEKRKNTKVESLAFVMVLALVCLTLAVCFAANQTQDGNTVAYAAELTMKGKGTKLEPYLIETAEELRELAVETNNTSAGFLGVYFTLCKDINLSDIYQSIEDGTWEPIGNSLTTPFKGEFDGSNFTVSGLNIARPQEGDVGLFGYLTQGGSISNLTVEGTVMGGTNTGAIVGHIVKGTVKNCVNKATVITDENTEAMNIGGIVGFNEGGTIDSCMNEGSITGTSYVTGGIVGANGGVVKNSINKGTIYNTSTKGILGGIAGMNTKKGNIFGEIKDVCNYGDVEAYSDVGGIVGMNEGIVSSAYNAGFAKAVFENAGGIVGNNIASGAIANSLVVSNIVCDENAKAVGAICSNNAGSVLYCFFSTDKFAGRLTSSGLTNGSFGLRDVDLVNADALTNEKKLFNLTSNMYGEGKWTKRAQTDSYAYYPELKTFSSSGDPDIVALSENNARIARKLVTNPSVALGKLSFVYNGKENEPDVYLNEEKLVKDLDYSSVCSNNIFAGEGNAASISIRFNNYYKGTVTKSFTVTQKELTDLKWTTEEIIFNKAVQHPVIDNFKGRVDEDNIEFEYTVTGGISVGNYRVIASLKNTETNKNYSVSGAYCDYEIKPCPITVQWESLSLTYDGKIQYPKVSSFSGDVSDDGITFLYNSEGKNAGKNAVTASLADTLVNKNYVLAETSALPHEYYISPRGLSVLWDSTPIYYSGKAQHPILNVTSGLVEGEKVVLAYSGFSGNINASESVCYTVYADLDNNDEMSANYSLLQTSKEYFICRKELSIEWSSTSLLFSGSAQAPAFSTLGAVNSEVIEFAYSDYSQNINASTGLSYSVTLSLEENQTNSNYLFEPLTKKYDIFPMPITIYWDGTPLIYNGEVQRPTAITFDALAQPISFAYSDYDAVYAGEGYTIVVTSENPNYVVQNVLTYAIEKKVIDISKLRFESAVFAHDGQEKSIHVTGGLPAMIKEVNYVGNKVRGVGMHSVEAVFVLQDPDNYKAIEPLAAEIHIVQMLFEYPAEGVKFDLQEAAPEAGIGFQLEIEKGQKPGFMDKNKTINIYDIVFLKNGVKSEPKSKVKVAIALTDEMTTAKNIYVVHLNDNGEAAPVDSYIEDGQIWFWAEHFSQYAVMSDITPSSTVFFILLGSLLGALVVVLLVLLKLKRNKAAMAFAAEGMQLGGVCDEADDVEFEYRGMKCKSFVSFAVSLNYRSVDKQREVCRRSAEDALKHVQSKAESDTVYWQGREVKKNSGKHKSLLAGAKRSQEREIRKTGKS